MLHPIHIGFDTLTLLQESRYECDSFCLRYVFKLASLFISIKQVLINQYIYMYYKFMNILLEETAINMAYIIFWCNFHKIRAF